MRISSILLSALLMASIFCSQSYSATLSKISEEEVRNVIEEYVHRKTDNLGADIRIKNISINGQTSVPAGEIEYEIKAPTHWEGWGSVNLAVIVRVDGRLKKNISAKVDVEALVNMVVSTRQLEAGEVVGVSDVAIQKRDLAKTGNKFCRNLSDVVGKRVKMSVRGNMPLRSDQLDKLPLVKSGQLVTILLESEMVRVTATGRVRGTGGAGDLVIVQNTSSQKDIQARVVDSSTVRVEF